MKRYPALHSAIYSEPWAIMPDKMSAIAAAFERYRSGATLSADELAIITGAAERPTHEPGTAVAVLPLFGTLAQHAGAEMRASGGTSTEAFAREFRNLVRNPAVGSIVIESHTPGGQVFGVQELSDEIFNARAVKPIIGVSNSLTASAGLWILSACTEVIATPGAQLGSVGIVSVHRDVSRAEDAEGVTTTVIATPARKAEGNPFEPLGDDARLAIEAKQSILFDRFVKALARNRGVSAAKVRSDFGGGDVLFAEQAKAAGMVDGIDTIANVVTSRIKPRRATRNTNKLRALSE